MAVRFERDDARRRVTVTIRGTLSSEEVLDIIERLRREDVWSYGLLYDLRHMTGEPSIDELRAFLSRAERRPGEPPRGPVAVFAADTTLYTRACTYAALGREKQMVEVFRDRREAEAWLTARTPGIADEP